ncbi:MAG: alcohol dehydrogenase [Phycisphaerae bacterium]|jgi:alcohol dehydrogenase class IV|nr:MAG: alcohol dehydrogenase [Phycisphaerae bacterium]
MTGSSVQSPITVHLPHRIAFGVGTFGRLQESLSISRFQKIFILSAPATREAAQQIADQLRPSGKTSIIWSDITTEPSITTFLTAARVATDFSPDCVIGIGGGSVLDVAKLIAALWTDPARIHDVFGIEKLDRRSTHLICIPTTAGTGSEVSPNAILLDEQENLKKGVISQWLVPDEAWCDPTLTLTVPSAFTAAVGMDALVHCIEAYANRFSHPMVDAWAIEGVRLISSSLKQAVLHGRDLESRSRVMLGALYGGMCLGPVNTGAVHALAYPLGSEFKVAHGVSNSVLLTHVMRFNLPSVEKKYADIALAMGVTAQKTERLTAEQGLEFLSNLSREIGIPQSLSALEVPQDAIPRMASAAMKVTRLLERNPRPVTYEDAVHIYQQAFL